MIKKIFLLFSIILPLIGFGQKKTMTPEVYKIWNRISDKKLSNNGQWSLYTVHPEKGNKTLYIHNNQSGENLVFPRANTPSFDHENETVAFITKPDYEEVRELKRMKMSDKELPSDTLSIYNLNHSTLNSIPDVKSYKVPAKWGGYIAYLMEPDSSTPDSLLQLERETKDTGTKLIVENIKSSEKDTLHYVTDFEFAEEGKGLVAYSKGIDSTVDQGIYVFDFDTKEWSLIYESSGDVYQLTWSKDAEYLSFIVDNDTSDNRVRPYELVLFEKSKSARKIADQMSSFLPEEYNISKHLKMRFSDDNKRLLFGIKPYPILRDTSLLDDEVVNVEVWTYNDDRLYTVKEDNLKEDKEKSYEVLYDVDNQSFRIINNEKFETTLFDEDLTNRYALGIEKTAYEKYLMWENYGYFDGYRIDLKSGQKIKFTTKDQGNIRLSPEGYFALWYSPQDSSFYSYDLKRNTKNMLVSNADGTFYNEENDRPMHPNSYGIAGFSEDEKYAYIYDRFDIWKVDMNGKKKPQRLTHGRESQIEYRVIDLDKEETAIDIHDSFLVRSFNDVDKSEGYHILDLKSGELTTLLSGDFRLDRNPIKAKDSDVLLITQESFKTFPDLILTNMSLTRRQTISNANPQQEEYKWGSIQLYSWKTFDDKDGSGLLLFPEGFDRSKKYPLLVNFYERSSDGLHRHRAPYAHRSTINYTYYLSKGYVIFNPDVYYRVGEPGQSSYDAVVSGVEALIDEGYIDAEKIGVQGHSWGGYQIADILTKTDIFKCAESGAPVVNMVSAYGGIRWGSGRSRMFQYEQTQSRLGKTLWEDPELYLKNSPIFKMDKMNTPVLILHNDQDGAVPWYQGIEYFNALRRLGKPAWFLNYNDEPHWPVKWQNKLDFNTRMEQFFDHFLMGTPMPVWMSKGVSPMQKGIEQGLELEKY